MKRAMALATRVECDEESDGFGGKSDGNECGRRLTATRAMAMVMASMWVMVTVTRRRATKRARVRVARAMATVMWVVGNEEAMATGVARVVAMTTMVAGEQ